MQARSRTKAVAFDVFETLFVPEPPAAKLPKLGLPASSLHGWLAAAQRDMAALAAAGDFREFSQILDQALVEVLAQYGTEASPEQRNDIVSSLASIPPRDDLKPCFDTLAHAGIVPFALTNGSVATATAMFENANLSVPKVVSVDEVGIGKPHRRVYEFAASALGLAASEVTLVAAHGWDVNGAKAAGLSAGYLAIRPFPLPMRLPDFEASSLSDLAQQIVQL